MGRTQLEMWVSKGLPLSGLSFVGDCLPWAYLEDGFSRRLFCLSSSHLFIFMFLGKQGRRGLQ